ncbi:MAG: NADH-quinone oxidoreductase subunit NuoG [Parachlamydiaceae bacterium]|nr:NADH-quinone oxidoreductase subunit NuoG [Parachlamydiaceae bacterium]
MTEQMINLIIDGQSIAVLKGTTVYQAARQLGIELPIFCYQDRMPPFGACRVCMVEVEKMAKPQTSCTLEATEGMVVKTQSLLAVKSRERILELLLINHPLDCPICDKGGECPLQDQTLRFGPGLSRFFEEKRHFKKPIPLGPVLMLDRERCVVCARCTRFGDIVAGDHALEFFERGYRTEVGTPDGGPADSKFIGNTIAICPVGALTSNVYRFRARPWDNTPTETTCTLCPVGCSMILDSRDGEIMRTRACENRALNDIWLCDKGWFGYEFSSSPDRLTTPLMRRNGQLQSATWEEALAFIAQKIQGAKPHGKLAGFGGNPLTVEENDLFQQFMRRSAGSEHVDHRIGMPMLTLEQEGISAGMPLSIGACEDLSYAFLLGIDLTEEFPVIWLRLKQAINKGAHVVFSGHFSPEISTHLSNVYLHAPGKELTVLQQLQPQLANLANEGKLGALFVGSQYLNTPQRSEILAELSQWQQRYPNLTLNILEGRGNSQGARLAGMLPDSNKNGLNALQVLEHAAHEGWDYLHVAGADPATHVPKKLWNEARAKLKCLVVQDLFLTQTAKQADVVLPTFAFVEKRGHFVNIEGKLLAIQPGKDTSEGLYSDGEIFLALADLLGVAISSDVSTLQRTVNPISSNASVQKSEPIAEGALRASFARALFDEGVLMTHNPHLIQLAKAPFVRVHPNEAKKRGLRHGHVVTIRSKEGFLEAKLHWDTNVAEETIVIPVGFKQIAAYELDRNLTNGIAIDVEIVEK